FIYSSLIVIRIFSPSPRSARHLLLWQQYSNTHMWEPCYAPSYYLALQEYQATFVSIECSPSMLKNVLAKNRRLNNANFVQYLMLHCYVLTKIQYVFKHCIFKELPHDVRNVVSNVCASRRKCRSKVGNTVYIMHAW